jgi:hypothetical protein
MRHLHHLTTLFDSLEFKALCRAGKYSEWILSRSSTDLLPMLCAVGEFASVQDARPTTWTQFHYAPRDVSSVCQFASWTLSVLRSVRDLHGLVWLIGSTGSTHYADACVALRSLGLGHPTTFQIAGADVPIPEAVLPIRSGVRGAHVPSPDSVVFTSDSVAPLLPQKRSLVTAEIEPSLQFGSMFLFRGEPASKHTEVDDKRG